MDITQTLLARYGKLEKILSKERLEMNFGFWTSLLDKRYEQVFWPALLKPTYPFMPRRIRTRAHISARLNKIRLLRNRVFHHEPIWYWKDLWQQYLAIKEVIGWIEPEMLLFISKIDRFESIYGNGMGVYA